jgi:hypothetical protein
MSPFRSVRRRARILAPLALAVALVGGSGVAAVATDRPLAAPVSTVAAVGAAAPHIPAVLQCGALVQNGATSNTGVPDFGALKDAPTRVTAAVVVPATSSTPEYCDVHGYVMSQVKFELKLPTTSWQGRYLQMGCGGFCGSIADTSFPACSTQLGGDFAIAATNDGHDGAGTDGLWAGNDQQARIDFGNRAVHVVSIAAKAIQKAYYGRGPNHSYFVGCSAGGREGLMEAQRYPTDFDGIVSGAPATAQSTNPLWLSFQVGVNSDAKGNPILTADKLPALHAAVVAACDRNDGILGDGLIGDYRDCSFDPGSIRCKGADAATCLTAAQVAVVRAIYSGVRDSNGILLDPRVTPRGSENTWAGWIVPVPAGAGSPAGTAPTWIAKSFGESASRYMSYPIGKGKPLADVRFTLSEFRTLIAGAAISDAYSSNLTKFRAHGGKLLMYQGLADPLAPPTGTFDYYDAVRRTMGGQAKVDQFLRLFAIPGMGHCGGGPTPNTSDLLLQTVNWVEQGAAPASITVTDTDPRGAARVRPVFTYPQVAKYVGPDPAVDPSGPDKPANFVAAAPAHRHSDVTLWAGQYLLYTT